MLNINRGYISTLFLVLFPIFAFASNTHSQDLTASQIIEKAWPCVVKISVLDKNGDHYTGTGFFISPSRILTCAHVLREACYASISFDFPLDSDTIDNEKISILKIDHNSDLALLEPDTQNQFYLRLAENYEYRPGQPVYTVGFPLGRRKTASEGIISTKVFRRFRIGLTAPVSAGNSGSPVINQEGDVIGVFFEADDEGQNLNFSISLPTIKEFLAQPDNPHKLNLDDIALNEDSACLVASILKNIKKTGLDVLHFISSVGREIFFILIDIISFLVVFLLLLAAVKGIHKAFSLGTFKEKLKRLFLLFLTPSIVIIWFIAGISLYHLLYDLFGKDSFLVSTSVVVSSIIIGTILYFIIKKIWERHAKTIQNQ